MYTLPGSLFRSSYCKIARCVSYIYFVNCITMVLYRHLASWFQPLCLIDACVAVSSKYGAVAAPSLFNLH